jgi:prepilin peptidase CpaA
LYLIRARGAGDVKLLAAVGAITGPGNVLWIFLLTAVLGGIIALVLLLFRGRLRKTFFNVGWIIQDLIHFRAPYRSSDELDVTTTKGLRLPHGAMIAVGSVAFIFMAQHGFGIL